MSSGRMEHIVTISGHMFCEDNMATVRAEVVEHNVPATYVTVHRCDHQPGRHLETSDGQQDLAHKTR